KSAHNCAVPHQMLSVRGDSPHSTRFCRHRSSYLELPHTVLYITRQYLIVLISSVFYFCAFNNRSRSDLDALKIVPCLCPIGTEILWLAFLNVLKSVVDTAS